MATYYVGPGGNDVNDGLSWGNRFLTLNGAEDEPVAAADTVYVGPGVYREDLTCDVDGTSGNIITYIGDVTGENTDGIGGEVRITGSDNDTSMARGNCINDGSGIDYRTFRGFSMDMSSSTCIRADSGSTNWTIEDCVLHDNGGTAIYAVHASTRSWVVRRSVFYNNGGANIRFDVGSAVDNAGFEIYNCLLIGSGGNDDSIIIDFAGDSIIRNCTIMGSMDDGIDIQGAPNASHQVLINNCIISGHDNFGIEATATGDVLEDYNTFWENGSGDRSNVDTGANSVVYPPLFVPPLLKDGFMLPWRYGELSEHSGVGRIVGSNEQTEDLYGIFRPSTAAKNSWGGIQLREGERETGTVDAGSVSLKLADAGDHQIYVPTTNASTTFSCEVHREADYAGTNPRMIIRQPGVADDVTTDGAAASQFNTLTTTLTPAANPPYVVVILRSLNTATSGNFATFFDTFDVS